MPTRPPAVPCFRALAQRRSARKREKRARMWARGRPPSTDRQPIRCSTLSTRAGSPAAITRTSLSPPRGAPETGRANVGTQVTHALLDCSLLLEYKNTHTDSYTTHTTTTHIKLL